MSRSGRSDRYGTTDFQAWQIDVNDEPNSAYDTLERLVPGQLEERDATGADTLRLHLERYRFAARHARPGRLLDMACGVGYGTRLLADNGPQVMAVGVDISQSAIDHARKHYASERTEYILQDALRFHDAAGFDTIVSLETMEHVPDPDALMQRLCDLLKPGGMLIASVPTTPSVDVNPHHLNDFTARSFRRMAMRRGLQEIASLAQIQPYSLVRVLGRRERRTRDLRSNLLAYYCVHPVRLLERLWATVRYGFSNRYLTCAWEKRAAG